MADLTFKISGTCETPTKTVVKARNFTMIIDEPPTLGGKDEGANPVEYLLAALAGCLNVVGHLVAKEMNMDLKRMEIEIEGKLNPEKFSGKETIDRAGFKEIKVLIKIETDADEETLKKWLEAVERRCPVSDNISNPTPVKITFKKESSCCG